MATLTIADLDNGKRDLETVDAVANSPQDFTTTRYGDQVLTLSGALRRLGYKAPVPYASGLSVDSGLFTVGRDGVVYAPNPSLVPFTTGAWDASQWRVVQNTPDSRQVYQFATLAQAQSAAATLPDGSSIVVEGESQGRVAAGAYVPDSGTSAVRLNGYTELRAYAGKARAVDITAAGIAGRFYRRGSSADDGAVVIVDALGRSWERCYAGVPNVKWWGAKGDGVTQDYPAIQAALNSSAKALYFPVGKYLCDKTLNITNRAVTGKPLYLKGEAAAYDDGGVTGGSVIISNPGNGNWIAELAGSQFTVIEDLKFVSTGAGSASYGLLYGRTPGSTYAQNNSLRRVIVRLESKGGTTIAVGNNCTEHFVMDECWLEADIPFVSTLNNDFNFTPQYATITNAVLSNTAYSVKLSTFTPLTGAAMVLVGLASATFDNCVWIPTSGNVHSAGIVFRSSGVGYSDCMNIRLTGQIESFVNPLYFEGNTHNIFARLSTSNVTGPHALAYSATTHNNLELAPTLLNGTGLSVVKGTSSITLVGGEITIPSGAVQVSPEVKFEGTSIIGGKLNMSDPAKFSCAQGSSLHPQWYASRIYGAGAWTPGAVASGSAVAVTFSVAGAQVGDEVSVAWPYPSQGCMISGSVDSANVVRLLLINLTGATATFGAGNFKVVLSRPVNSA